jgi:hypothetical protein
MSIYIAAHPTTDDVTSDTEEVPAGGALRDRLRLAFVQRVEHYHRELAGALGVSSYDEGTSYTSYPEVGVNFEGEEESLLLDPQLLTRLFDIYAFYGWNGIRQVEEVVRAEAFPPYSDPPSGGTKVSVWPAAWTFFVFCRNTLALLIREELVELEHLSARHLVTQLSEVAAAVATVWRAQLKITRTVHKKGRNLGHGNAAVVDAAAYRFGDRDLAAALHKALIAAVEQRVAYEHAVQLLGTRTGCDPRGNVPMTAEPTPAELLEARAQASRFLGGMTEILHLNCPFGLVVLNGLQPTSTQAEMEELLGEALWQLYSRLDELGSAVDPGADHVSALLPTVSREGRVSWVEIQRLPVDRRGPEDLVLQSAMERVAGAPEYFPLVHEASLRNLVASGAIERDSLAYVVCEQYCAALADQAEAQRAAEEGVRSVWKAVATFAAAASLAVLVTPGAGVAPVLRGVALVADAALLYHTVTSAVQQLRLLDELLDEQLMAPDALALAGLARVGELRAYRHEMTDSLPEQVLVELVLLAAGQNWPALKKLLLVRGYLNDLETLMADG